MPGGNQSHQGWICGQPGRKKIGESALEPCNLSLENRSRSGRLPEVRPAIGDDDWQRDFPMADSSAMQPPAADSGARLPPVFAGGDLHCR
ncbi:hypothetical protein [Ureibacillus terrenus]|uniref:Uncharacterized protein n=1 Tax=Ureibacillus terrenus TaxID=118246 RepID=A0A540V2D4_9BACL|nr:hypothetical protein [Ureibacillus terrenus]MED3661397.1 hypothetical protein [Ureibacillus terrenus]MED3764130.1 hypothetical protein [Ureibacillus terrenus]TQE90912.1 hypothetical protein FKZ59_07855 [Ureibacillus terrenus]